MKIFFARHGKYVNPDNIEPSRLPGFPLSVDGIKQVEHTASILADLKIRAIYTSPIERCVETAAIISKHLHLYPNQKEALIEVGTPLQGTKKADMPSDLYNDPRHIEGGGETQLQIFERVANFISGLKELSKNSNFLIVSHGDPMMIFLRKTLGEDIRYIPMGGLISIEFGKNIKPVYTEII